MFKDLVEVIGVDDCGHATTTAREVGRRVLVAHGQ
jgi:hypothetical protein